MFVLSAGGAPDTQRDGPEPGSAADPEGDGAEESEDSGFRRFWNSLQGGFVSTVSSLAELFGLRDLLRSQWWDVGQLAEKTLESNLENLNMATERAFYLFVAVFPDRFKAEEKFKDVEGKPSACQHHCPWQIIHATPILCKLAE